MNKQIIAHDNLELDQLDSLRRDMQQDVRRHYQSKGVAVVIPFYQSLISGLLAGVLVAILLYALGVRAKWIIIGFALTWIAVTAIVWWVRLRDWQSLIWNMEQTMGFDLTGDQVIGRPVSPTTIRAEVTSGNNTRVAELSGSSLYLFFKAIRSGQDISEARWTPQSNGFAKSDYWRTVAELIRLGVLHWRNEDAHAQGVASTTEAPEILDQWIREIESR